MSLSVLAKPGWNNPPAAPPAGPGPGAGNVYLVTSSIDHTGATDVTMALQTFINGALDGTSGTPSTIRFQPSGIYRCESTIAIIDRNWLNLDLNGGTLLRTVPGTLRTNYNLQIASSLTGTCANINIYGGTIQGSNPATSLATNKYNSALEAQHNINFAGNVQNVTVGAVNGAQGDFTNPATCVNLLSPYGDNCYFGAGLPATVFPSNVRVTGCKLLWAGRQSTSPVAGSTVRVDHCTIGGSNRHCYDAEPDGATWVMNGLQLDHNTVLQCGLGYLAGNGAGTVNNVNVHDDVLTGFAPGIVVSNRHPGTRLNWAISNVTTDSSAAGTTPPGGLFQLTNVDGFVATNINVPLAAGRSDYGAQLTGCTSFSFSGCSFPNSVATYIERPFIDTCTPATDTAAGGTSLTITGRLLNTISAIHIGGIPTTSFVATDATHATCVSPTAVPLAKTATATIPADKSGVPQPSSNHFSDSNMRVASVVVTNAAGTVTYALTTDYTIAYHSGINAWEITRTLGGALAALTPVVINFTHYDVVGVNPVDSFGEAPNGFNFQYTPID